MGRRTGNITTSSQDVSTHINRLVAEVTTLDAETRFHLTDPHEDTRIQTPRWRCV
jgi:hypothetical protein